MTREAASGSIVWLTGLPASGKTTLAERTRAALAGDGRAAVVLDSDALRDVLGAHGYAAGARDDFYRALADLAALLAAQAVIVLVAATAPRRAHRDRARQSGHRFLEVWVRTPRADCEARDVKGLYARARAGEITELPGVGAPFEPPDDAGVIADGGHDATAVDRICRWLRAGGSATG
ncbi:MAG TPA: adenylyl-sulfate kinase [Kofleriaceae bacterium]|nr:adenylyl-sulfate kinase [Kofleriaceae bacterium]